MEYVIMIGMPLSGKSSYRKSNFYDHEVISLEKCKSRKEEMRIIEECLKERKDIVVDDTNLSKKIMNFLHVV